MMLDALLDLLSLNGIKGYLGGAGLMLGGVSSLLHSLGEIANTLAQFVTFHISIMDVVPQLSTEVAASWMFFLGLTAVGIRHAQSKNAAVVVDAVKEAAAGAGE